MTMEEFMSTISKIYPELSVYVEDKGVVKLISFLQKNGKIESSFIVQKFENLIDSHIEMFTAMRQNAEKSLSILSATKNPIYIDNNIRFDLKKFN